MSKPYKVVGPRPVNDADPGQEFAAELSAEEESDLLEAGRIEIVPREYENVGGGLVHGVKPGEKFKAALRIHEEKALISAGAVEIVKSKGASAPPKKESK